MNIFILFFVLLFFTLYTKLQAEYKSSAIRTEIFNKKIKREELKFKKYSPDWADLDKRPLPAWYDQAKIGIFIHWGVFSVPSFGSEWFWYEWHINKPQYVNFMKKNYPPGFTYQDFASAFTAEFYEPEKWAQLFAQSGAKYVVLTSKHHEGYTLFPSKKSVSWNSVDVGPKRDLVGDLAKAVRKEHLKFGLYYSLHEWFNPIYRKDSKEQFKTRVYPDTKVWPEIKQLVNDYKPSVIWSDGDWDALDSYWQSQKLIAWLYNDSPVKDEVVVNDRWDKGTFRRRVQSCRRGDFYNCPDRYNPGVLQSHKWENCFSIDVPSFGYRREMELKDVLTIEHILKEIVVTVSCGGNVLINIGPTKEGTISPIFQERLSQMGQWLAINGEGIYSSSPWLHQNDTLNGDVWYTCTKTKYNASKPTAPPNSDETITALYAFVLKWPEKNVLKVTDMTKVLHSGYKVEMLGVSSGNLTWKILNKETHITLPDKASVKSQYAWTLKFTKK